MSKNPINRTVEEVTIISSAIIMAVTITPFAIYRYSNGQYTVALFEMLSVGLMCAISTYVWNTRKTVLMSLATSIFMLAGLVTFNYILSTTIIFWIYPIITAVYFLNSLKVSAMLVNPAIIALLPILIGERTTLEVVSIVVTLIICQLFGFLLSSKTRHQYKSMQGLINQDGLTGALNRRAFDERVEYLHDFSLRHYYKRETTSSMIMLDIDDFKAINDSYDHQEGDQILINITKLIKKNIRSIDQLYRYGGEEFVVISNGSDTLKAAELAEKLRLILESSNISDCTKVTASFGIAELQRNEPVSRWIDRADKAMYRAKRAGKNRVFIANFDRKEDDGIIVNSVKA